MDIFFLTMGRHATKIYEKLENAICVEHDLTLMEMDILLFLANNPQYVTAKDIVNYRMIAKSHVSISVENLLKKGLLTKTSNQKRNIPLALTPQGLVIAKEGQQMQETFQNIYMEGFNEEDSKKLEEFHQRISENLLRAYEELK